MSEQSSGEPTMEEILASIRRIISEDEQPAEEKVPEPEPEPEPAQAAPPPFIPSDPDPEPASAPPSIEIPADEEDDALELTQKVETHGDLDVLAPGAAMEEVGEPPPPVAGHQAFWPDKGQKLVSDPTEEMAAAAFGRLSSSILMPAYGRTLEDVVRELLAPLLKQWLDDNLPRIVQNAVDEEVARIARGGRPPGA